MLGLFVWVVLGHVDLSLQKSARKINTAQYLFEYLDLV